MQFLATIFIILLTILTGCGEEAPNNNIIKFGLSPDYPPFEFKKNGEFVGFDVDLAKLVAKELGKEAKFHEMEFNSIFASLANHHIDAGISTISATEERKNNFDFSGEYHFAGMASIFDKQHPITKKEDLQGKKIACQLGSTMEIWLKKQVNPDQITSFDNNNQAIEALKSGHVQAVIVDSDQAMAFCDNNPSLSSHVIELAENGFVIAFPKGSELTNQINKAISKLQADGSIDALKAKWLGAKK